MRTWWSSSPSTPPSLPRYPTCLLPPFRAGRVRSSRPSPSPLYRRFGLCCLERFFDLAALHEVQPSVKLDAVLAGSAIYNVPLPFGGANRVMARASLDGVGAVAEEEIRRYRVFAVPAGEQVGTVAAHEVVGAVTTEQLVVGRGRHVAVTGEPVGGAQ